MAKVNPGDRRHRITIVQKTSTADGSGGFTESWAEFATVWAAIWPASAKEVLRQGKIEQISVIPVNIRYLAGVTPEMRILLGGQTFEILGSLNHDLACDALDLLCQELL